MKRIAIVLLSLVGGIALAYVGYKHLRYYDLNAVRRELDSIEGVEVLSMWGHEDVTLEEISARIRIRNKLEMVIWGLKPGFQFEYPGRIVLPKIGPYSFMWVNCQTHTDCEVVVGFGSSLDLSPQEIFNYRFEGKINDVRDLVSRAEEIVAILDTVPHYPDWVHIVDEQGTENFCAVIENDTSKYYVTWDPLMKIGSLEQLQATLPWRDTCCKHNP